MGSCNDCFYSANRNGNNIICKYFNKVVNIKNYNGCSSFKSRIFKSGIKNNIYEK